MIFDWWLLYPPVNKHSHGKSRIFLVNTINMVGFPWLCVLVYRSVNIIVVFFWDFSPLNVMYKQLEQVSPKKTIPSLKLTVRTCQFAPFQKETHLPTQVFRCYVSFRECIPPQNGRDHHLDDLGSLQMISKWVITPTYPIYKLVFSHLLTIDPNFPGHPSKNLQNFCMHPESHPHPAVPVDDEHRTPLFGKNTEVLSCEKFKQREENLPKIFDTQRISMEKN